MSDRIADLEQRVATLEAECASLAAIALVLINEADAVDRKAWADAFEAVHIRWPEVPLSDIQRGARGIIAAALRQAGRPGA